MSRPDTPDRPSAAFPRGVLDPRCPSGHEIETHTDRRLLWHVGTMLAVSATNDTLRDLSSAVAAYLNETCEHHWHESPAEDDMEAFRQCLWCCVVESLPSEPVDHTDLFGATISDAIAQAEPVSSSVDGEAVETGPEMHGDHPFEPGIDVDMVAEGRSPDPRWCNVCGESRPVVPPSARVGGETDDECDREQCKQIAVTASEVYCDITGGKLSYPTYDTRTILAEANEYTQQLIDEETESLRAQLRDAQAENEKYQERLSEHVDCEHRNAAELRKLHAEIDRLRGPFPCCAHCADDPEYHAENEPNSHDAECGRCGDPAVLRAERDEARAALARVTTTIGALSAQLIRAYPNQHAPLLSAVEVRVLVLDHLRAALTVQGDANPEATDE